MNQSMKEGLLIAVALGLALVAAQGTASGYMLKGSVDNSVMEFESGVADDFSISGYESSG
ncbi:MAG: hypothetical protein H0V34_09815 [Gammaproteobacteria bacterium]|nr:hypothetical protein [Gammaproteobacteria bacterium]